MDDLADRLKKLEEAQGFSEHAAEQMHGELIRALELIEQLRRRVEALERRADAPPAADADDESEDFR